MLNRSSTRVARRPLSARTGSLVFFGSALTAASVALSGCAPCTGVTSCTDAPRLSVSGQIVDRGNPSDADRDALSGANIPEPQPVSGVRVEVVPRAGDAVDTARAVSTTDGSGWWQVAIPARAEGAVTVDVRVTAPGSTGYTVHGLALRATRVRGDGNVLGRWTRDVYLTLLGEVHDAPSGAAVEGARVTATRRSGIEVEPTGNTRMPMITVGGGRFLYDVRPLGDGALTLDFVIERVGRPVATVPNVTVYPKHEWLPPNVDGAVIFSIDSAGHRANAPQSARVRTRPVPATSRRGGVHDAETSGPRT